ncbi:hypothetical protein AAIR98_001161 [Elusimicrobium simillimum]|uniref:hypothetical protein n=1 Tax=Elusimicrobium simillimum TaxID=3143438 RepID=UPI003C705F1D
MFCLKRAAWVVLVTVTSALHALTVESITPEDGTLRFNFGAFEITNVEYEDGRLLMPLERDDYKNITVLTRSLADKLTECFDSCSLKKNSNKNIKFNVMEVAPVGKIYLATAAFDGELAVTFIVSKNYKGNIIVRRPSDFIFKDKDFETKLKNAVRAKVKEYESNKPS